jgi:TPR repeat protein
MNGGIAMSQTKINFPSIYNPTNQSAEEILSNFVVRTKEFKELFDLIKNDKMEKPAQHFIIQGQRGYGKTTLLLRLKYEILNDEELSDWLIPVMFDEEQYSVRTLAKLWEEVLDVLEDGNTSFAGLTDIADTLYDKEAPEEEIFDLLINALKERNKKIILLLDNFGDMIERFNKKENQRLREILITCDQLRLVGASSKILEFYYDYKNPFFDFFKLINLEELDKDEAILLLKKLGETYKSEQINKIIAEQPERIEALRRISGGIPRTIVLLFQIFVDDTNGDSFKDLETILDQVTPLYKQRMDSLTPPQQAIVDAVAQNWDAISTKEISKKVRIPSKEVSSQLNYLVKSQIVTKIQTSTKNHLYQISERFFNIYYLMRLGRRKNRNKVLWLIKFFEIMCGENELIDRAQRHIKGIREGSVYDKHAFYVSQALARTHLPNEVQHELINETKKYLSAKQSEYSKDICKSHFEIWGEVKQDVINDKFDLAKRKLKDDGMDPAEIPFAIAEFTRTEKKDFKLAVKFYEEAISKGYNGAMNNLALMFQTEFKDFKQAEKYYLMAIEKGNSDAMFNLALMFQTEFKDFKQAEKYYLMAIEKGNSDAMNNLALMFQTEFKDFKQAEKYYLMAIEKGNSDAMNNLAWLYFELKNNKIRALEIQRKAFENIKHDYAAHTFLMILLWNDEIEEGAKIFKDYFENENALKDVNEMVFSALKMFLAKNQYHFVYNLFAENKFDIRDKYKPVYYATLSLLGQKYSDELKRMPPELKETVGDLLKEIEQMNNDYK